MASNAIPIREVTPQSPASATTHWWPRLRRWLLPAFAILVLGLLAANAHRVDWEGAWAALKRYPPLLLLAVLGICTASHALYGCFDLVGRRHTLHGLPAWRVWAISVTSYAFNLNLGSLVGGVAMRARLYARAGLDEATIAQVVGLSLTTNWLGYGLVAGSLFAADIITPPSQAHISNIALRLIGVGLILLAVVYVAACAFCQGREWRVRGRTLHLPSAWLAVVQLAISAANWAFMGLAMYVLLGEKVEYTTVLAVLMAASIVGVITPIPAGLGVLEAVYLALLHGSVRQGTLLGAVLAYRVLYYLVPLAGGLVLYGLLERYASAHPAEPTADAGATPPSA